MDIPSICLTIMMVMACVIVMLFVVGLAVGFHTKVSECWRGFVAAWVIGISAGVYFSQQIIHNTQGPSGPAPTHPNTIKE